MQKIYKIVNDLNIFSNELSTLLTTIKNLKHSTYVCGDYNMKIKINKHCRKYIHENISHSFSQKTIPTKICDSSSTLIDIIFTKNIKEAKIFDILLNLIAK